MSPRKTELESGGGVKGVATALVTQNKDPESLCRVKVRYPWHDKPTVSYWARIAMPMAGKDRGLVVIPGGRRRGRRGLRARGLALPLRAWRAVERERQAAARK